MPHVDSLEGQELATQARALKMLKGLSLPAAIGVACSFLLDCAYNHRVEFRRVMNERVIREGFRGVSLLEVFKRQSQ